MDRALNEAAVAALVAEQLAQIADQRVVDVLSKYLVPPRPCLLEWDYGHPHPEFPEPKYPGFIVMEHPGSGTGIAYSDYGSGPDMPWVLIAIEHPRFGMDSSWFDSLEDAFQNSFASNELSTAR